MQDILLLKNFLLPEKVQLGYDVWNEWKIIFSSENEREIIGRHYSMFTMGLDGFNQERFKNAPNIETKRCQRKECSSLIRLEEFLRY